VTASTATTRRSAAISDRTGACIVVLVGLTALRLAVSGRHRLYVRAGMGLWIGLAGAALAVLGAWRFLRPAPRPIGDHDHAHGVPPVALLLLAPVLVVFLVAPPSLGSFAAERAAQRTPPAAAADTAKAFSPLPAPVDGAVDLSLTAYNDREWYEAGSTLDGVALRLTGFVVHGDEPGTVLLTRFRIACCAADAVPIQVLVRGVPEPLPPVDRWIAVVGRHRAGIVDGRAVIDADRVSPTRPPAEPYE
jgi:uncharacterized repeat protein (TIGR03943 family)